MDANGLKFCMLARAGDWAPAGDSVQYDSASHTLRLARHRAMPDWPPDTASAEKALATVPQSIDRYGTRAFWSAGDGALLATGAAPGFERIYPAPGDPPVAGTVTDVALGYDDLLYLAAGGGITIIDPRERFRPARISAPVGFAAWRLAAHPAGGVWALDKDNHKLAQLVGSPSTIRPHPPYSVDTVRPCEENPDPPRIVVLAGAQWPGDERAVAIASSAGGRLGILLWKTGEVARLRLLTAANALGDAILLGGMRTPFSFAWNSETQVAVLLANLKEAPVYSPDDPGSPVPPDGDFYPLKNHDGGPFLHSLTAPLQYPAVEGSRGLYRLSLPSFAPSGSAENAVVCDGGSPGAVWHRLYLEAEIPDHCGVVVQLGAVDHPTDAPKQWFPHQFGGVFAPDGSTPRGAWVPRASEVPWAPPLLACDSEKNRAGLFTALIQRAGKRVRGLRGRYLKIRVELRGTGIQTPEIAALRAYASRFSYAAHYLPELYREDTFGDDAEQNAPATPADFLERMLDNFEGVLTPIEDRIADSYLLTRAGTTPPESLEWLGNWIGIAFDSAYSDDQRRTMIQSAPELFRRRGTAKGLALALDIATNGAVRRGQFVILENWRLRRTFATILGADLSDEDDPLTAGISRSGNSFVGDTLFLGDPHRKEFLALFGAALPKTRLEALAVQSFFDQLANRVTILVHQEITPQNLGLVRRVAALETPAHVAVTVEAASNEFRAGVASLLGVDTYLTPKPVPGTARVDVSYIGRGDLIGRAPALDPRLGGERQEAESPPVAQLTAPDTAEFGGSFTISGAGSNASEGHKIVNYTWTLLD